ncbi:Hypothetical predicted protein [Octopus vulgaris]|uniref:Uncharacterized protein n=1 Tax=Octopus vulgaris TaxID=6645 RepID=A0AA36ASX2_OCTVU|nr:Hypothetical predicted protein [Octopus vulgaris]
MAISLYQSKSYLLVSHWKRIRASGFHICRMCTYLINYYRDTYSEKFKESSDSAVVKPENTREHPRTPENIRPIHDLI